MATLLTSIEPPDSQGSADLVAEIDNYSPVHPAMRAANALLNVWEKWGGPLKRALRRRGLAFAIEYMVPAGPLDRRFPSITAQWPLLSLFSPSSLPLPLSPP